jgi:hypothetical protein
MSLSPFVFLTRFLFMSYLVPSILAETVL